MIRTVATNTQQDGKQRKFRPQQQPEISAALILSQGASLQAEDGQTMLNSARSNVRATYVTCMHDMCHAQCPAIAQQGNRNIVIIPIRSSPSYDYGNSTGNMQSIVFLLIIFASTICVSRAFTPGAKLSTNSLLPGSASAATAVKKIPFVPRPKTSLSMAKADQELVCLTTVSDDKYDALSEYIVAWAKLLANDPKGNGLTTAITVDASYPDPDEDVAKVSGVKLLFLKTKTGDAYKSKEEERAIEEGDAEEAPEKDVKEGGVELLVEQRKDGTVRLRAKRCEVDDETIVKEMSEEAIVSGLKKAVDVFNKER